MTDRLESSSERNRRNLHTAAAVAVLAFVVLAGLPMTLNGWKTWAETRRRIAERDAHLARASAYIKQGRFEMAAIAQRNAQAAAVVDSRARAGADRLAVLRVVATPGALNARNLDEIEYLVDKGLANPSAILPDLHQYLVARGNILATRGKVEEALKAYDEALKKKADFAPAHYYKGKVTLAMGKADEGIKMMEKALEYDPAHLYALASLGKVFLDKGDLDKAKGYLDRAAGIRPDALVSYYLGLIASRKKDTKTAVDHFTAAYRLNPDLENLRESFGQALFGLKRYHEAADLFQAAFRRTRNPDTYFNLGVCYRELGRLKRAVQVFRNILASQPNHLMARYELARGLEAMGARPEDVAQHWRIFLQLGAGRKELSRQLDYARARLAAAPATAAGGTAGDVPRRNAPAGAPK